MMYPATWDSESFRAKSIINCYSSSFSKPGRAKKGTNISHNHDPEVTNDVNSFVLKLERTFKFGITTCFDVIRYHNMKSYMISSPYIHILHFMTYEF